MVMLGSFVITCKVIEPAPLSSYLNYAPAILTFPFFSPIERIYLEFMDGIEKEADKSRPVRLRL